jgi:hypothetical protein
MPDGRFELAFSGRYPRLSFIDGENRLDIAPARVFMCDPVHLVSSAVLGTLRGEEYPPVCLLEEPGEYRVHLARDGTSVQCRVEYARENFVGAPAELLFEGTYEIRRFAQDVAKGILDCSAAGMPVPQQAVESAREILATLRGESPGPWKRVDRASGP